MTKAAIYARTSGQGQTGGDIEAQIRSCRDHAERAGWTVAEIFRDLASGANDRPGLRALLERAGEFDVLVVATLDRLGRDRGDVAETLERLANAHCRVATIADKGASDRS